MRTWMEVRMLDTLYVGLHRFCKMSRQIWPSAYTVERGGGEVEESLTAKWIVKEPDTARHMAQHYSE